jgi:hypothetical protein
MVLNLAAAHSSRFGTARLENMLRVQSRVVGNVLTELAVEEIYSSPLECAGFIEETEDK